MLSSPSIYTDDCAASPGELQCASLLLRIQDQLMDAPAPISFERLNILGSRIASVDYAQAVEIILARAQQPKPGAYVCAANVHCVSMARRDAAYRAVLNGALLTVPDGMPLVWAHRFLVGRHPKDR